MKLCTCQLYNAPPYHPTYVSQRWVMTKEKKDWLTWESWTQYVSHHSDLEVCHFTSLSVTNNLGWVSYWCFFMWQILVLSVFCVTVVWVIVHECTVTFVTEGESKEVFSRVTNVQWLTLSGGKGVRHTVDKCIKWDVISLSLTCKCKMYR